MFDLIYCSRYTNNQLNRTMLTPDRTIFDQAIEALARTTGIKIEIIAYEPAEAHADAYVKIRVHDRKYEYVVAIKAVDRFAALGQVKLQLQTFKQKPLLIAPQLTDDAVDKCRTLDLNFIDLAGNAYLTGPDLFLLIKGQKADRNKVAPITGKRAGTATNLRMVFTLLCNPDMLNAPYREIGKAAGIALGTIGWVFQYLDTRGFTLGDPRKGNRNLLMKEKLTQEWVTNYPIKLRPKLNPKKFTAPNRDWWKNLDILKYNAQWGGEVAADKLTHYLKPNFVTVYLHGEEIKKNMTRLVIDHRLKPDPYGDIEILDTFWNFDDEQLMPDTVPPLLIYADLVATNDPRNLETAKMIYDQYIKNAIDQV